DPDHSEKWAVTFYGKVVKRYATRRDARIAVKHYNAKLQEGPTRRAHDFHRTEHQSAALDQLVTARPDSQCVVSRPGLSFHPRRVGALTSPAFNSQTVCIRHQVCGS